MKDLIVKMLFPVLLLIFVLSGTVSAQKFTSDIETFKQYKYPGWFMDAKFGIWSHWGPQAVPRQGDWYARKMYESDVRDWNTKEFTLSLIHI